MTSKYAKKALKEKTDADDTAKKVLILKGTSTSQTINDVLIDIALLSKPNCKTFNKKNDILPFEDVNSLEFLCGKNECSLFALGSNTKKRPNNLVLGRMYDGHLLDMVEFGIDAKASITDFVSKKKGLGSKPVMVFLGDQWDRDSSFKGIQNILLDFFRGDRPEKISVKGIDHIISCSVVDGKIFIRAYSVTFTKSDSKVANAQLEPMGPFLDLSIRRSQFSSTDLMKAACQKAVNTAKPPKVKNVERTVMGDKIGRIHMEHQNLDKMGGRRMNVLRNGGGGNKKKKVDDESGAKRGGGAGVDAERSAKRSKAK